MKKPKTGDIAITKKANWNVGRDQHLVFSIASQHYLILEELNNGNTFEGLYDRYRVLHLESNEIYDTHFINNIDRVI